MHLQSKTLEQEKKATHSCSKEASESKAPFGRDTRLLYDMYLPTNARKWTCLHSLFTWPVAPPYSSVREASEVKMPGGGDVISLCDRSLAIDMHKQQAETTVQQHTSLFLHPRSRFF